MTRKEFINWCEERFALTKNDIYEFGQLYDEVTKPHWISVDDELPKEYEEVLAIANVDGNIVPFVGVCENGMFYFIEPTIRKERRVTHWMPLPQAPKEGGEE